MSERAKQVVVPRRRAETRRMGNSKKLSVSGMLARARTIGKIALVVAGVALIIFSYHKLAASSLFQLRNIEVTGNQRVSSAEIERLVHQNLSATFISTDLEVLQEQLQSITWIKRAQLTRILPDTLRVQVEERKPLALTRFEGQQAYWIDEDAVVLGEFDISVDKNVPPIVYGFTQDMSESARADNRERVELYKRLMRAFDTGELKYSSQIEEIDISNLRDVRLQLKPGPVEVDLGDRDFRARLVRALDLLDALRRRDSAVLKNYQFLDPQILEDPDRIRFISVVHPTQVAIRPSKVSQNRAPTERVARAEGDR